MKEAAGEANMTVVTIILIAAIVAIATPIVTSMMNNSGKQACCMSAGGVWKSNKCYTVSSTGTGAGTAMSDSDFWDATNKACK